jgi:D-galactarolactone cycloisomerase
MADGHGSSEDVASRTSRIARIEVFVVRSPIDPPCGVSIGLATSHEYALVRIEDSDGRAGWGETYLLPGVSETIVDLGAGLLGADPLAVRAHRAALLQTRSSRYAQSALMIALDDLRARQLEVPVHRLYGGPTRTSVVAYAASQGYVDDVPPEDAWAQEAASYVAAGYTAVKLRVGRYRVAREARVLAEVRQVVGDDIALMVDGNGAYTGPEALAMGRVLGELGFRWFEEPLPQWGYRGYPELATALDIALAGGEVVETSDEALGLLASRGVDILQPEVVICGGIEGALRIADLAELYGISVVPHTSGGAIGIAATLHLLACLGDTSASPAAIPPLLEFGQGPNPWRTDLLTSPLEPAGGVVSVPLGPGLGVQVDESFLRAQAVHQATSG